MTREIKAPKGRVIVPGSASGKLIVSQTPLSFMMGVDPVTGMIVDHHHPLQGRIIKDQILAIPRGRGSCSGSGVILELLMQGKGPAAFIFSKAEEILTLGVLVAKVLFEKSIPIIVLDEAVFATLSDGETAHISETALRLNSQQTHIELAPATLPDPSGSSIAISDDEKEMLSGSYGEARKVSMEAIYHFAKLQGATSFIPVSGVHIDTCYYCGPSTLLFAERLHSMGGKFAGPTTLNSISVDRRRWRELGTDPAFGEAASKVADLYVAMGAKPSFTCAPYLRNDKPKLGEQVGWAESNAVVFANSVLGARTQKYPDFLDVFIGLTGRAPAAGCHLDEGRKPKVLIEVEHLAKVDDSFWPLLGHRVGEISESDIPFISGIEHLKPTIADLKAFGAAFATTSSAPMFHIAGITPEALQTVPLKQNLRNAKIALSVLQKTHRQLNSARDSSLGLISLGNPHFSPEEFRILSALCEGRRRHPDVRVVVTTSRESYDMAEAAGHIDTITDYGAEVITDTCWCFITEPIIPVHVKNLMTTSGKYAHYGPGMVQRGVHFGSLADCIDAACAGKREYYVPTWLHEQS
ncbi:hypothetical protein BU24DRAFT_89696 [Aaosphaeria arxii CBS 175.79]|uniref:DUF521-domain-containing protein n=1 Tax=Aaosphaeria arxii CBS 175.79 TaxID=1450172 RepID=A0A6A5X7X4_9PLEO|nr:uncharacterized protein BU24DRAFT_89696 [Aaosphaeria arxii CBS 175.79]KAF2009006.1 hypothetical protein BU24DRAFT_89696 [Aaosphaeria arxii CBS 175.79]